MSKYWETLEKKRKPFAAASLAVFSLSSCGGGAKVTTEGFPSSYVPPEPNYDSPINTDPYQEILKVQYIDPYWVLALEMDQYELHISPIISDYDSVIEYTFPDVQPEYNHFNINGWQPATDHMKVAAREIFSKLNLILDVSFTEGAEPFATNVIAIGRSTQSTSSGISYLPNFYYKIGMDIFIADGYAKPRFVNELLTNYDYEVLVHELGHALGLKHPFEAYGTNTVVLSSYEDNTSNTAMSYKEDFTTFDATFRPLDWMALTKFYGVKDSYNAGDDNYSFSSSGGVFIVDGAGIDKISAKNTVLDVIIDLRPGAHSSLGNKSQYISDANQLTISYDSDIEIVETGSGNDTIIATHVDNVISTGAGSDIIFAGEGADTINSGGGTDQIDLSELVQATDTVIFESANSVEIGVDTIYGFAQGILGDILDVSAILSSTGTLFPSVALGSAPNANISYGVLRLIGSDLKNAPNLLEAFQKGGGADSLSISSGASSIIISAASQATGEDQYVYQLEERNGGVDATHLAVLMGNYLDIDQWQIDNFSFIA